MDKFEYITIVLTAGFLLFSSIREQTRQNRKNVHAEDNASEQTVQLDRKSVV